MRKITCMAVLILIFHGFCSSQTKKTENGVLYIENGIKSELEEQGKAVQLNKILSIGRTDGKDEEMLYGMTDLKVDAEGNIFVTERSTKSVKKFNAKGELLFKFGRDGDGPGEFRNPLKLFLCPNKDIYILDSQGIISRFNSKGKFVISFKTRSFASDFVIGSTGSFYVYENVYSDRKISVYDKHGKFINSFGDIVKRKNGSETGFVNSGVMAIDEKDNIYLSSNQPYKIEKYDKTGKLLMVISKKISYPIVEPNYKEEKTSDGMMVTQNQATKIAKYLQVINQKIYHLIMPSNSFLSMGRYIDVFDMNGNYLCQMDMKVSDIRAIAVDKNEALYAVVESLGLKVEKGKMEETSQIPKIVKYKINILNK